MSNLLPDSEKTLDNNSQNAVQGSAYHNESNEGEALMPPKLQFENNSDSNSHSGDSKSEQDKGDAQDNTWVTPRENEEIQSKAKAKEKLTEIKYRIRFLLGMAEKMPGDIKMPGSVGELVNLASECDDIRKRMTEEDDGTPHLDYTDAELLNAISFDVESSYGGVFNVLAAQSQRAASNIASIPTLDQLDGALREKLRSNFEGKDEAAMNKIMNAIDGTAEYNQLISVIKSTASKARNKIMGVAWAEYMETLEKPVKEGLQKFVAKANFAYTLFNNLTDIFGADPDHATEGLRKTFDTVDTIIGNPFLKASFPLWTAYQPAIKFCLDAIDEMGKNKKEERRRLGLLKGLYKFVEDNQKDKISAYMCAGLPGKDDKGKQELLYFMMDVHSKSLESVEKVPVADSVNTFFFENKDLINSGDGSDKLKVDYGIPIYSGDDKLEDVKYNVWQHKGVIWSMLYGKLLNPPSI